MSPSSVLQSSHGAITEDEDRAAGAAGQDQVQLLVEDEETGCRM